MTGPEAPSDREAEGSAFAAERARAAEDRRRIDRLGGALPDRPSTPRSQAAPALDRLKPALRRIRTAIGRPRPGVPRPSTRVDAPPDGLLRFAVCLAAPNDKMASRWGDWHFAGGLARALERRGHVAHVLTAEHHVDDRARNCDVRIVLRGLQRVAPIPGTVHVLWIISHPETIDIAECDEADLVLVASTRFAAHLRTRTRTPVEVLLQATDHHRFRPVPPRPEHAHPVVVVAKTRDVARSVVRDAVAVGLRPAIYGTGWEQFVDPALVERSYVANEELPIVYSSATVVLADHWASMREWGFVSNRVFDVLACGTAVVSDDLPELRQLFGDAVATYHDPDELRLAVDSARTDADDGSERVARGRSTVLEAHTFDHRAARILELVRSSAPEGGRR